MLVRRRDERDAQWGRRRFCCTTCANRANPGRKRKATVTYGALHLRVAADRGKPKLCSVCGMDDPLRLYEWANLTGKLDDVYDYARMCRSCHRRFDFAREGSYQANKTHCPQGHPYDELNTRVKNGHRRCKTCDRERSRRYKERKRGRASVE